MILANNRSTKLGTLICSAHAWTVRPTGADRPASGPDRPRAQIGAQQLLKSIMKYLNKILYIFYMYYFLSTTKKKKKNIRIHIRIDIRILYQLFKKI
jgi:mannose/fructose/N-acetylgalactosamine-specific phosphotransferase system component IID